MTINPDGRQSEGVTPSGSGYSAEPEPCSTVSAVPVSIPNAATDGALANAIERRNEIERQMPLLSAELKRLDRFIAQWFDIAGVPMPSALIRAGKTRRIPRAPNPPKESVAAEAVAVLLESKRPMKRRELLEALISRGITLNGKDPSMVLSTMLWRSQDKVIRTRAGYVPAAGIGA